MPADLKKVKEAQRLLELHKNPQKALLNELVDINDSVKGFVKVVSDIKIPETDLSNTNQLLKEMLDKKDEPIDINVKLTLI